MIDISFYTESELPQLGLAKIGSNVLISKAAAILGGANIEIENDVRIDAFSILTAVQGFIKIGSNVHIASYCSILGRGGVTLSRYSGLSHGVRVFSASDDYSGKYLTNPTVPITMTNVSVAEVFVGEHVIVGANSVILPGVKIGEGSAVGAQSLVARSLEPWGIYSGCPAKFLKTRSSSLLELVDSTD